MKLIVRPAVVHPGEAFVIEAQLTSRTETPVDFVHVRLNGHEQLTERVGNATSYHRRKIVEQEVRHDPGTLRPGKHAFAGRFQVPAGAPASFHAGDAMIEYWADVHVSIPWWPDRRQSYAIPIHWAPREVGPAVPVSFATSAVGPVGEIPYMEAAIDRTELVAGETIAGTVSVANVRGKKIRGLSLAFIGGRANAGVRYAAPIYQGQVEENVPIPFQVTFPLLAPPTFRGQILSMSYVLELRADVAWGDDVVLRVPLVVQPPGRMRRASAPLVPIGRQRRALVWNAVAARLGLANDAEAERMSARYGDVALTVSVEQRPRDTYVAATLSWPHLGLDLALNERAWTDVLGGGVTLARPSRRFTVHAREAAQARALLDPPLLDLLESLDEAHVDDDGARLALRGNVHAVDRTTMQVGRFDAIARQLAERMPRVPPPAKMAASFGAWEAFAARVHGRLERGSLAVSGTWGAQPFAIATLWSRDAEPHGTRIAAILDPPLEAAPDPESPAVSAAAREEMKALAAAAPCRFGVDAVEMMLHDVLPDPGAAEPWIERLTRLARALRGQTQAGPFR